MVRKLSCVGGAGGASWPKGMLALACFMGILAHGQPGAAQANWQVRVDCVELSAEERAEIEVRHLVELEALHTKPRTLVLSCNEASVMGGWEYEGRVVSQRLVTRAEGDNLLELHHWLASMLASAGPSDPSATGAPSALSAQESRPQATPTAESLPPESAPAVAPAVTAASAERDKPPSSTEGASGQSSLASRSSVETSPSSNSQPTSWRVGFGAVYEQWGTEVPGAAGLGVDGSLLFYRPVGVHVASSFTWAIGDANGFAARALALGVHLEVEVQPWLSLFAGPVLSWTELYDSTDSTRAPSDSVTLGGELLGRANFPLKSLGGFAALGIRGLVSERRIRLNGEDQLTVPAVQGVFTLGVQWGAR